MLVLSLSLNNLLLKFTHSLFLITLLAAIIFAVSDIHAQKTQMEDSIKGNWGGEHISLEITDSGVNIELDCAHAVVKSPLKPDQSGRFEFAGIYTQQIGGAVRQNAVNPSYRIKIAGQIRGKKMTLTIRRQSTGKSLGIFKLTQGKEPFIVKCL